ncbi:helicase associated domain-containing protein [Streptomyces mirabilis]|uniref:helicase associated domain-containing protein n=1 Tax=Streptomyces mirabilis TaxID=68239 RepID=UPI00367B529B
MTLQGEDLGAWVTAQRLGWDQLLPAQQWMLENMLHIGPATADERPPAPRTQADKWAANLTAARLFHAREGHLHVPRKHVEDIDGIPYKLGQFVDNARRRADKLTEERRAELDTLGMRW